MVVATVAGCGSTKDNADKKQGGEPNSKLLDYPWISSLKAG